MTTFLSIIIPFHYEQGRIAKVLIKLNQAVICPYEVLLVHDDPNDPTLPVIENIQKTNPPIHTLLNQHARGIPGAIRTGLEHALGNVIVFLVADDEGAVDSLPAMIKLMNEGYDLVNASRYVPGGSGKGGHPLARAFSRNANGAFRVLAGAKLTDTSCGIKMFKKSLLEKITLRSDRDWTLAFELAVKAQCLGCHMAEVPLVSYNRLDGSPSHFKMWPRLSNYGRVFIWGLFKLRTKRLHA